MPFGYNGKILHVDLTHGKLEVEEPPEAFYRKYMGGSAMGMYYILRDMPAGVDALAPENVLTLMASVTTGAPISGQSRLNANAKSPVSGAIGDSQSGGFFPAELKFAGFDGIVVKGRSPRPVYLSILDGEAEPARRRSPGGQGHRRGGCASCAGGGRAESRSLAVWPGSRKRRAVLQPGLDG